MNLAPSLLQSILDPSGQQLATLKDATSGKHVPLVALYGKELLYADALPTSTTYVDLVAAPGTGLRIRIHALYYANNDGALKSMQMRFGAGAARFIASVAASTGFVTIPIPPTGLVLGGANEALQVALVTGTAAAARAVCLYSIESE
jgi:hypothetical protein